MTARDRPAQRPPRHGLDFARFPARTLRPSTRLRIHRAKRRGREAWWFASCPDDGPGGGRFDLPSPRGTCYWATTAEAAIRELVGPFLAEHGWVSAALIADRELATAPRPAGLRMASLEDPRANREFGVLGELDAMADYAVPQRWAASIADGGLDGIAYRARFSGPGRPNAYAFFGDAGVDASRPVDAAVTDVDATVCAAAGIEVVPVLGEGIAAQFDITDPPA